MINMICDKCNFNMNGSDVLTAQAYNKDAKYLYNENGKLNVDIFDSYIVFVCNKCGNTKKLSFLDILNEEKKIILNLVALLRSEQCSKTSRRIGLSEDSGISYCGVCPGFCDGDGYCFNDAIKNCEFRRQIVES